VKLQDKARNFLAEFKEIAQKRGIDVIQRQKNILDLAKLSITKKNRNDEIMTLSVDDYCKGPEPDKDKPGEIWVFGKRIGREEVYIKLKIAKVGKKKIAKCISFHAPNYPLCYPFKKKSKEKGGR